MNIKNITPITVKTGRNKKPGFITDMVIGRGSTGTANANLTTISLRRNRIAFKPYFRYLLASFIKLKTL